MIRRARKHPSLVRRLSAAGPPSALAFVLVLVVAAPLAFGATAPGRQARTSASHASHRGKCAPHARRRAHRHRRCTSTRRAAAKAPPAEPPPLAPSPALIAQPAPLIAALPLPPAPVSSAPASEGAKPTEGGGEAGEGVEPPSVPHVQVSAVEYAFTLSRTNVPAGKVVIEFVNDGQDEHNLQVAPPGEGPLAGSFAKLPAKGVSDLQLEMQPGEYKLFCSLPTHEQKGMKATLTVE